MFLSLDNNTPHTDSVQKWGRQCANPGELYSIYWSFYGIYFCHLMCMCDFLLLSLCSLGKLIQDFYVDFHFFSAQGDNVPLHSIITRNHFYPFFFSPSVYLCIHCHTIPSTHLTYPSPHLSPLYTSRTKHLHSLL